MTAQDSMLLAQESAKKKPLRILHILSSLNRGGVETWFVNLLRNMDREKFEITCLITGAKGVYAQDLCNLGIEIIECPLVKGFSKRFMGILRNNKYDIVHSHLFLFSAYLLYLAKRAGVPGRISHGHTTSDGKKLTLLRFCYHKLMQFLLSRYAILGLGGSRAIMAGLYGKKWEKKNNRKVLYYGIDLEPFDKEYNRAKIRKKNLIPVNAKVVGHVGRFCPPKNHRFLVDVANQVIKRSGDVYFVLCGNGPLKTNIEEKIRSLRIESKVILFSQVDNIAELMIGGMDAFILPSTREGLPLVTLEAQAAGLRMLVSEAVTQEVAIVDKAVEFESLNAGAEKWAQRILELLDKKPLNQKDSLAKVRSSAFSIDNCVKILSEIYLNLMREVEVINGAY